MGIGSLPVQLGVERRGLGRLRVMALPQASWSRCCSAGARRLHALGGRLRCWRAAAC